MRRRIINTIAKIEYAAEKVLPKEVLADGRDSFIALHDVTSHGRHFQKNSASQFLIVVI